MQKLATIQTTELVIDLLGEPFWLSRPSRISIWNFQVKILNVKPKWKSLQFPNSQFWIEELIGFASLRRVI